MVSSMQNSKMTSLSQDKVSSCKTAPTDLIESSYGFIIHKTAPKRTHCFDGSVVRGSILHCSMIPEFVMKALFLQ
jgi:hypothetical protein